MNIYFWSKVNIWNVNTLGPRQHRRRFADDIFKCIFVNENCCILNKIPLKFVRKGPIDKNPALVQIMAWHRLGDKPLSEPMVLSLLTHICVTRPQWVNCARAMAFIFDTRTDVLMKVSKFLRQKMSQPEGSPKRWSAIALSNVPDLWGHKSSPNNELKKPNLREVSKLKLSAHCFL